VDCSRRASAASGSGAAQPAGSRCDTKSNSNVPWLGVLSAASHGVAPRLQIESEN
jgi:hypothetical protein